MGWSPVRPLGLRTLLVLGAVSALVLTGFAGEGSLHGSMPSVASDHGPLAAAVASLAEGAGPAGGVAMACTSAGAGASCSSVESPREANASQINWVNLSYDQSRSPIPRSYGRSLAYDPTDHYVVLFGGFTGSGYVGDTWTFANGSWTQLHPSKSPSARDHSTLVWDPVDGYLVLFGGSGDSGQVGDTWTFLQGNWTQVTTSTHPSARWSASMTWDAADGYVLLFGGCAGTEQSDTWKFLGGNWTQLHPSIHPSNRGDAGMTYDPLDGYVVLFGGYDSGSTWGYFNDTWVFSAGNWTQLTPSIAPSARTSPSYAFDPWMGGVVLFGGAGATSILGDSWLFAHGGWTALAPASAPPAREFGIMATDYADRYLLLFGGQGYNLYNDTWALYSANLTVNASTVQGSSPLRVSLTATPVGPFAFVPTTWTYGDGTDGTGNSTAHVYASPGYFTLTATSVDEEGLTLSASLSVSVRLGLGLFAAVAPTTGQVPLPLSLIADAYGGTPPYRWAWTMQGAPIATTENASFTVSVAGQYSVEVLVSDSEGAVRNQSFLVSASAPVVPSLSGEFTESVTGGEAPLSVAFIAVPAGGVAPVRAEWSFGDGQTALGSVVNHTYLGAGTFVANLTLSDAAGQTYYVDHSLEVAPPVSVTASASLTSGTAPLNVTLSAVETGGLGPYYYVWHFGDGDSGAGARVTHVYTSGGPKVANVTVIDGAGRQASTTVGVNVAPGSSSSSPSGVASGSTVDVTATVLAAELVVGAVAVVALVLFARRRP